MPFDYSLVAIENTTSGYVVRSQLQDACLDLSQLPTSHQIDVSADNIYEEFVAPLAIWQAKKCLPSRPEVAERISQWLDALPYATAFILMHTSEFEAFGGD